MSWSLFNKLTGDDENWIYLYRWLLTMSDSLMGGLLHVCNHKRMMNNLQDVKSSKRWFNVNVDLIAIQQHQKRMMLLKGSKQDDDDLREGVQKRIHG